MHVSVFTIKLGSHNASLVRKHATDCITDCSLSDSSLDISSLTLVIESLHRVLAMLSDSKVVLLPRLSHISIRVVCGIFCMQEMRKENNNMKWQYIF